MSRPLRMVARAALRTAPWRFLFGLALALVATVAGIGLLGLSGWFVAATAAAGVGGAGFAFDVFRPGAGVRVLALLRTAGRYGERLMSHDTTLRVLADWRARLFLAYARLEPSRFDRLRSATVTFRLTNDLEALDGLYLRLVLPIMVAVLMLIGVVAGLGLVSGWLALSVGGPLALAVVLVPWLGDRFGRKASRRRGYALEALRGRLSTLLSGHTELLVTGHLEPARQEVREADRRLRLADNALDRADAYTGLLGSVAGLVAVVATLLVGAQLVRSDTIPAPLAIMAVLVAFAALEVVPPLRRGAAELGRLALAGSRLGPMLGDWGSAAPPNPLAKGHGPLEPVTFSGPAPASAAALAGAGPEKTGGFGGPVAPRAGVGGRQPPNTALSADRVSFRYAEAQRGSLFEVSFVIRPGERVGVVGASGSGKSTLMGLIAGLYQPDSGSLVVEPHFGVLSQSSALFRATVADNLRLAAPAADDDALWAALARAGLADAVHCLPQGLATRLGDGGAGLSGGQARRLALARLVLQAPALWLLDEPTEGLDDTTAQGVINRLGEAVGSATLVVASHRRQDLKAMERLLVLAEGRLVADVRRGDQGFAAVLEGLR